MDSNWDPRTARQVRRGLEDMLDKRVSQDQLAGWLGYSRTSVQSWEKGRAVPEPAVRFLYDKLLSDPGFIVEVQQWSNQHASQQQTSEA